MITSTSISSSYFVDVVYIFAYVVECISSVLLCLKQGFNIANDHEHGEYFIFFTETIVKLLQYYTSTDELLVIIYCRILKATPSEMKHIFQ